MGIPQTIATCISCILQLVCKYEACKAVSHCDQLITAHPVLSPLFRLFILHLIQVLFCPKATPSCAKHFHVAAI